MASQLGASFRATSHAWSRDVGLRCLSRLRRQASAVPEGRPRPAGRAADALVEALVAPATLQGSTRTAAEVGEPERVWMETERISGTSSRDASEASCTASCRSCSDRAMNHTHVTWDGHAKRRSVTKISHQLDEPPSTAKKCWHSSSAAGFHSKSSLTFSLSNQNLES